MEKESKSISNNIDKLLPDAVFSKKTSPSIWTQNIKLHLRRFSLSTKIFSAESDFKYDADHSWGKNVVYRMALKLSHSKENRRREDNTFVVEKRNDVCVRQI